MFHSSHVQFLVNITKCVLLLKGLRHQRKMTSGCIVRGREKIVMKGFCKILFFVNNSTHTHKNTQFLASAGIFLLFTAYNIIKGVL